MEMRFVPTKVHGAVDYATGPVLTLAPEIFRMKDGRSASLPPRVAGVGATALSALSNHELAVKRVLPMRAHLALDALAGTAVAAAPWIGGSAKKGKRHWIPHALVGAQEIALALTTKTEPERRKAAGVPVKGLALGAVAASVAAGGAWLAWSRFRRDGDTGPEPENANENA
jgi:hypothetical protein